MHWLGLLFTLHSAFSENVNQSQELLFVGGLQRTGTTNVAEALGRLPFSAVQSTKYLDSSKLADLKPWLLHGFSEKYFSSVLKTGGVEGKFVQNVYPYRSVSSYARSSTRLVSYSSFVQVFYFRPRLRHREKSLNGYRATLSRDRGLLA